MHPEVSADETTIVSCTIGVAVPANVALACLISDRDLRAQVILIIKRVLVVDIEPDGLDVRP